MPPRIKNIPWDDIKGIQTLLDEGKTHAEIALYHHVSQDTISRRIKQYKKEEGDQDSDSTEA